MTDHPQFFAWSQVRAPLRIASPLYAHPLNSTIIAALGISRHRCAALGHLSQFDARQLYSAQTQRT